MATLVFSCVWELSKTSAIGSRFGEVSRVALHSFNACEAELAVCQAQLAEAQKKLFDVNLKIEKLEDDYTQALAKQSELEDDMRLCE
eukprot:611837-Amphidinium_carterae.1